VCSSDLEILDFGFKPDEGMGLNEPTPKESAPAKPMKKEEPFHQPVSGKLPKAAPKQSEDKEEIVTQNYEQTVAIKEAKKKLDDQKRKVYLEKQLSDKRTRDSLQKMNNERITEQNHLAEIQRQDSLKKAAEQSKIDQINSRAKNAFGGVSGKGTDETSMGEGNTNKPGNQGSPDGAPGVKKYGTGVGTGNRISYNLSGRSALSLPKPSYPGNNEGIVVVEVNVDKYGNVTKANVGVKGSTSLDANLLEAARKAAFSTKFNINLDAPAFQTGTITYHFVLN
jgi:colicin import membrane protein